MVADLINTWRYNQTKRETKINLNYTMCLILRKIVDEPSGS